MEEFEQVHFLLKIIGFSELGSVTLSIVDPCVFIIDIGLNVGVLGRKIS